jgi:selenocysteine lyase/cysteine desulfurase
MFVCTWRSRSLECRAFTGGLKRLRRLNFFPMNLFPDEAQRRELFPVCRDKIFLAHAGVTALPGFVADAVCAYTRQSAENPQEFGDVLREVKEARRVCAEFIGGRPEEIALLGPTSLGLSLFANGLEWKAGDEVVCYHGDYPANVYPWLDLRRRGVIVRYLEPARPGEITPELVEAALTPRTKLVALASAHFFTGYRIDLEAIGTLVHSRGILFSVDAIQTLGAFPLDVERAHVDFLSADAHKWMLGPLAIGIVYVRRERFEVLRPTLLGAWNVVSPNFNALDEIRFVPTAQRYEPGVLNIAGILGMRAALDFFRAKGMETIAGRLLELKAYLTPRLEELGFSILGPGVGSPAATSITTCRHERTSGAALFAALERANVIASLRHDREGREYLRFSPHCYNTEAELDVVLAALRSAMG